MRTKRSFVVLCAIVAGMAAVSPADAGRQSTLVAATDLSTHSPTDATLGAYYVLRFDIPDGIQGQPLRWAILEFYCDVSAKDVDGYVNEIPAVQVFALTSEFSGTLDPNQFEPQALPVARNVAIKTGGS